MTEHVVTFGAFCKSCGATFELPLLGDQSYGLFIAQDPDARKFAYLCSFDNPGWNLVKQVYESVTPFPRDNRSNGPHAECFQWVLGKCADPLGESELSIIGPHRCRVCGSDSLSYPLTSHATGSMELPLMSFEAFLKQTPAGRTARVGSLCTQWRQMHDESQRA
jgi:hypothetical protein